jgi:FHA domain-containing protein
VIWIEILSRHRDTAARYRIAGPEARVGRGYDNDVIVDDPYVAAQHLRVYRDEAGRLVAEDMGSANGIFLDRGKKRQDRIVIDGSHPIRIGQTFLRVREIGHAVEPERVVQPERPILPIVLAAMLGVATLGTIGGRIWLAQTSEPRASTYLTPLLVNTATVLGWAGLWSLLSRIFSGRSHFLRNLLIALSGLFVFLLYDLIARFSAFAWTWSAASTYQYVAVWSIFAAVVFLHLREVGPGRLLLKGALVTTLLATAIAVQTLQLSEAFSESGRQNTASLLLPPMFRLVQLRDEGAFFAEIGKLKATLDGDRIKARADEAAQ